MNRRGFLGRFFAASIAASLYPVDFVLRHSRKLKATWTMTMGEMQAYHSLDVETHLIVQEHARLIREDIDAQILRRLTEKT